METETVDLARIYKKNGKLCITFSRDVDKIYELYGFMKCFVKSLEKDLIKQFEKFEDD